MYNTYIKYSKLEQIQSWFANTAEEGSHNLEKKREEIWNPVDPSPLLKLFA